MEWSARIQVSNEMRQRGKKKHEKRQKETIAKRIWKTCAPAEKEKRSIFIDRQDILREMKTIERGTQMMRDV